MPDPIQPEEQQAELRMAVSTRPTTANEEARTIEVVIATEAPINGLVLRCDSQSVEMSPGVIPILMDHRPDQIQAMAGRIRDIRFEGRQMIGLAEFKDAPAAEIGWQLARSGVNVSVGAYYQSSNRKALPGGGGVVDRWTLRHAALTPQGADPLCVSRSFAPSDAMTASAPGPEANKQATAAPAAAAAPPAAAPPAAGGTETRAAAPAAAPPAAPADQTAELRAAAMEREARIWRTCSEARVPPAKAAEYVAGGLSYNEVVDAILRAQMPVPPTAEQLRVTRDAGDSDMIGMRESIEFRCGAIAKPTDAGRRFLGFTTLELCRAQLNRVGVNTEGMSKSELVTRSFNSSSDFPLLFEHIADKTLHRGYEEEPHTWKPLARQKNLPDFKLSTNVQIAGQIIPTELLEGGEYQSSTLTEGKSTWSIDTYARKISLTRKAIINDDLSALERIPEILGRGCRLLESNMIWNLITTGTNGATVNADGKALFHADHNNTGSGVIGITGFNDGKLAMRMQTDIAGNRLNIMPAYMLVPAALETTALQFLYPQGWLPPTLTGDTGTNIFAGSVQLIVEPRLDDDSELIYYLAASPGRTDMITYGYLAGEEGPTITRVEERDPDGMTLLVRMDFGATLDDYRGFYRSTGA